ncbi:hypothetical protein [Dysosmobacter sp.]|uniref:hypothetical protein n=1 Tax=Dysosmobacter sp. TaxID=2591382 RepID=UPI002A8658F3|nr:hypothetical protein [Dysosmobacter sp.]MDY3282368.1 hypothetical protein [Dysosmobacter sp.]
MILLWVLGILLGLLVLVCLLRVGAVVSYDGTLTVRAAVGPFRFQAVPGKEPKKEKPKRKKPEQEPAPEKTKEKKKPAFPRPDRSDIRSAVSELWPPLKRALGRTRRGIRIAPLEVSVVLGGRDDPAKAAENYGYANAAVWSAMPALEQLLDIPHPHIHIGMDFEQGQDCFGVRAGVTIRVGTLLAVGLQIGIPALKWYLRFRKRHKQAATPNTEPAEKRPAA